MEFKDASSEVSEGSGVSFTTVLRNWSGLGAGSPTGKASVHYVFSNCSNYKCEDRTSCVSSEYSCNGAICYNASSSEPMMEYTTQEDCENVGGIWQSGGASTWGQAIQGEDYEDGTLGGIIEFANFESSKPLDFGIIQDTVFEGSDGDEDFYITLIDPVDHDYNGITQIGTQNVHKVTIKNDDA